MIATHLVMFFLGGASGTADPVSSTILPDASELWFHLQPLGRETVTIGSGATRLTQALIDNTSETKAGNQFASKRRKARAARIVVDSSNSIRWTTTGTAPVGATTGILGKQYDVIWLSGYSQMTKFQAIRDGGSDSSIQVEYFG